MAANRLKTIVSGLEHIPVNGPALIAARHYHHLFDGLAMLTTIPRRFHIVVALDWAQNKPTKFFFATINRLARWPTLLRGDAFVRRADERHNLFSERDLLRYQHEAMRQSVDLLVEGRVLVIFPEGYPNIDPIYTPKTEPEEFLPFKAGFASIVSAAEKKLNRQIPIIPAGLHYTIGNPWIGHLRFGAPVYRDPRTGNQELVEIVEGAVKRLSSETR
ncbi:MAG TPA: 1-acyl-sn-glycerol-3-phosphate acyltransferase [Candidatus Limnocylindria bacterium]|nr:1-acyl-sn-glycerol-3-phosphate acyltransferase [Candidatus Limnocylindria bacterium]